MQICEEEPRVQEQQVPVKTVALCPKSHQKLMLLFAQKRAVTDYDSKFRSYVP